MLDPHAELRFVNTNRVSVFPQWCCGSNSWCQKPTSLPLPRPRKWRRRWPKMFKIQTMVPLSYFDTNIFSCSLQEKYVTEVSAHKVNMLLLNKADLLTIEQRRHWARYFQKEDIRAVFWSALAEAQRLEAEEKVIHKAGLQWCSCFQVGLEHHIYGFDTFYLRHFWSSVHAFSFQFILQGEEQPDQEDQSDAEQEGTSEDPTNLHEENKTEGKTRGESEDEGGRVHGSFDETDWQTCSEESGDEEEHTNTTAASSFYNSSRLLRKNELLDIFKSAHSGSTSKDGQITVGLVSFTVMELQ